MVQQLRLGFHSIGCWLESSLVAKNPHATCLEQPKKKKKTTKEREKPLCLLLTLRKRVLFFISLRKKLKNTIIQRPVRKVLILSELMTK